MESLAHRIIKAIKEKTVLKVILVVPLLPGFGGDITQKDGQLLRIQIG